MTPEQIDSHERMKALLNVSRILAVTTELDPLLEKIAQGATTILACERASIFIHDEQKNELWAKVALKADAVIRVPVGSGIVGFAMAENRIIDEPSPYENTRFNREIDRKTGFVTRNLLAAPMVDIDNQPLGVIQAVNKTTGAFTAEDRISIQLLAAQAGVAIQRHRLQTVAREEIRLMREMELARDVQNRVIPKSHPIVEGLTAVGKTVPASMTGGDCFDLWKASDGRLGLFLGDARSHGLPAALVVSQARSVIRALTTTQLDPCKLLSQTNALLWDDYGGDGFTTAFLGFLAPDGWLTWSSAGQGPIYIRQSPGATLQVLNATATPLATLEEMAIEPSPKVRLNPGGMLTVTSDGIFEARNAADELFEISRLSDLLNRQVSRKPHEILSDIFNSVNQWQPPGEPRDDQTVIVAMVERAV